MSRRRRNAERGVRAGAIGEAAGSELRADIDAAPA